MDEDVRTAISGWKYSGHQNDATIKADREWYQCPWEQAPNKKLWITEHLKSGSSRKEEETIRIAFAWEPNAQKVVVGFIGQHQRNTLTN